jgi:tRNA modification GTPase
MPFLAKPSLNHEEPICCVLTATGRGAVAVVGLGGNCEHQVLALNELFEPIGSRRFIEIAQQAIVYGRWASTGEDLVVAKTSNGYEIQCHGGNAASTAIVRDLESNGFAAVELMEWRKCFCTLWQAETEQALCDATTERTARHLLQVLGVQEESLKQLAAMRDNEQHQQAIQSILDWADFGRHLTVPRSVVFCGQPNVGKSSLVNAIVGFDRAIVNERAGTTRDVLMQSTAIDGWPVTLKDTAGIRETSGEIEQQGIEKARQVVADADLRIAVFDSTKSFGENDLVMIQDLDPQLVVFNKTDLVPEFEIPNHSFNCPALKVSAVERTEMKSLLQMIASILVPELPAQDQWYPVTPSQVERLQSMIARPSLNASTRVQKKYR